MNTETGKPRLKPAGGEADADLSQLVLGLWRRRWVLMLAAALGALAALGLDWLHPPLYEASARVWLPAVELSGGTRLTPATLISVAQGQEVAAAVVKELGLDQGQRALTVDTFRFERLGGEPVRDTNLVAIRARLEDPRQAAAAVNRVAELAVERLKREIDDGTGAAIERTQALVGEARQRLDEARQRLAATKDTAGGAGTRDLERVSLELQAAQAGLALADVSARVESGQRDRAHRLAQFRVFERALPPETPVGSGLAKRVLAAAVAAYVLGVLGILLFDAFRLTVLGR